VGLHLCYKKYNYSNVDLSKYCKECDIKTCAIKLELTAHNIYVVSLQNTMCGNFNSFLNGLDSIVKSFYKVELKLIICGDINIDYPMGNEKKKQLDSVLLSYNLTATVHFPPEYKTNLTLL
jgi:hypothetical protein